MKLLDRRALQDVTNAARHLLGCEIHRTLADGTVLRAKIVETEAYHQKDPASHTYNGKSARNQAMFGPAGHAYVYFTYGLHWCFNVTAEAKGNGAGVLIRAAEPLTGITSMQQNRSLRAPSAQSSKMLYSLCNGPAKLAQALQIDDSLYGHNLGKPPLQIFEADNRDFEIVQTTRVGINKAVNELARFYVKSSPFISKP